MQEVSELRFEITHDARTRKIRPGSDLRHDVRYIYYMENLQQTRLCGARSGSPQLVVRWLFTNALATTVLTKQARREEGFEGVRTN